MSLIFYSLREHLIYTTNHLYETMSSNLSIISISIYLINNKKKKKKKDTARLKNFVPFTYKRDTWDSQRYCNFTLAKSRMKRNIKGKLKWCAEKTPARGACRYIDDECFATRDRRRVVCVFSEKLSFQSEKLWLWYIPGRCVYKHQVLAYLIKLLYNNVFENMKIIYI